MGQDVAFAATEGVDQNQSLTRNVCGVNARDANAAAISYLVIFGFRVSTIEQKCLHILHLPFMSSF